MPWLNWQNPRPLLRLTSIVMRAQKAEWEPRSGWRAPTAGRESPPVCVSNFSSRWLRGHRYGSDRFNVRLLGHKSTVLQDRCNWPLKTPCSIQYSLGL